MFLPKLFLRLLKERYLFLSNRAIHSCPLSAILHSVSAQLYLQVSLPPICGSIGSKFRPDGFRLAAESVRGRAFHGLALIAALPVMNDGMADSDRGLVMGPCELVHIFDASDMLLRPVFRMNPAAGLYGMTP